MLPVTNGDLPKWAARRSSNRLMLVQFIVQVFVCVTFIILAFVVLAWGEPGDPTLLEYRISELEKRLSSIESTRPGHITRLVVSEEAMKTTKERVDRLEKAAVAFFGLGSLGIGGSGMMSWKTWRRAKNGP